MSQLVRKTNLVKCFLVKYYLQNMKHNAQSDIDYNISLNSCLTGSKKWLIENTHIFKAEPIKLAT